MPPGLIEHDHRVGARCDRLGNFREMERHRGGVAFRQDQPGGLALGGADGAEQPSRLGPLIERSRGAAAAPSPAASDLRLLAKPGLVLSPQFQRLARRTEAAILSSSIGSFFKILNGARRLRMMARSGGKLAVAQSPHFPAHSLLARRYPEALEQPSGQVLQPLGLVPGR